MKILSGLFGKRARPGRVGDEEGFLDIDLPIVSLSRSATGSLRIEARGQIAGEIMGFAVVLFPGWQAQPLEDSDAAFYWGAGAYERTGNESDAFVRFVARRYGLPSTESLSMLREVPARVVGLRTDPAIALERGASTKFFFHSDSPERYAEVFTNINLGESLLEFREKDEEYRAALVRALSEA